MDSSESARKSVRSADAVRAAARLARVAGTALNEADLTLAQYRVLVFLDSGPRPATDVAALLDVTPSTVTSVVDGLVSRDLVNRGEDPGDRRRVILSLTSEGRVILREGDRVVSERLELLLDRLDAEGSESVLIGLEALNVAMNDYLLEKLGPTQDPA